MHPLDYQDRFHEALQKAFAATSPVVRNAYFELANYYREELGDQVLLHPSADLLRKVASRQRRRAA